MVLHALPPFVEIVVATFGEADLKRLPRRAVAAPKPLGDGTEIVGIDSEPGKRRPHLEQCAHAIRCRAPFKVLLGGMPPFMQPGAQRLDRTLAWGRSCLSLQLGD